MLKKITLTIGLAASGFVSAGMYSTPLAPSCIPADVTVPCEARQWDLGVQALYFQPTYTADKGYERTSLTGYKNTEPKWGWGYRIEGSYHYNTGDDATMTLIHFDSTTNRGGFSGLTSFSSTRLPYSLGLSNKFDQVNLVLGQRVDMGVWKKARFYGGLQYAKIRVEQRRIYSVVPAALLQQRATGVEQYHNGEVYGVGPVLGIDYSYNLVHGFSVTANTATSLVYGTSRFAEGFIIAPTGLVRFNDSLSHKIVVPSFEVKLGLNYVHEWFQGALNLEGGFQALNYFNVFKSREQINTHPSTTNFGLYGPYFGAKWVGNV
ncbi:MAG: hypothetical protein H0T84_01310 [Tatlockia sp.]|nr:hypothetical protein [Tatlockia sp.]